MTSSLSLTIFGSYVTLRVARLLSLSLSTSSLVQLKALKRSFVITIMKRVAVNVATIKGIHITDLQLRKSSMLDGQRREETSLFVFPRGISHR